MQNKRITLQEKSNYIGLDFFKIIGAFLVVAIHIHPLKSYSLGASYVLTEIICRVAVPIFFLCSGFFLGGKLQDWKKTRKYIGHILKMYVLWTILYMPQIFLRFWSATDTVLTNMLRIGQRILLIGSYIQLWYLLATIVAVWILYLLVHSIGFSKKTVLCIAFLLYVIGLLGNGYAKLTMSSQVGRAVLVAYRIILLTTRNGIFFGLLFIALGYYIGIHKNKIKKYPYFLLGVVSLVLMYLEDRAITNWIGEGAHDMYLFTVPTAVFLFLGFAFWNIKDRYQGVGARLRQYATDIFLVHLLINFYSKRFLGMFGVKLNNSLLHYVIVIILSIVISCLLQQVRKWRKAK